MIPEHASRPVSELAALLAIWRCDVCGVALHDRQRQRCNCEAQR